MQRAANPNRTGLSDALKHGVESLSGLSLDHVRVHRNSSKAGQLNAHAYAQGADIHLAPGQEKHLPHEAWHIVQQAQGRVRPSAQLRRTAINDDPALEREADTMGARASSVDPKPAQRRARAPSPGGFPAIVQRNRILKHEYRELENPAYTVASHVGWATGMEPEQVLPDLAYGVPHDRTLARPDRVIAQIDHRTGSGPRPGVITEIGHLGNLEEALRGRTELDFNGGHLIALELFNNWPLINTAYNLAPQRASDNKAPGEWRRAEIWLNDGAGPILYEASVTYPDRTYTVTAGGMAGALAPGSDSLTRLEAAPMWRRWTPWTVHCWTPSQFTLVATPLGTHAPTTHQSTFGPDPTNWMPVVARVASPLKGLLFRIVPVIQVVERHTGGGWTLGGIDVRTQQNHPIGDALNELKQLAIDLVRLTLIIERLFPNAIALTAQFVRMLPGLQSFIAPLADVLGDAPVAALLIYAFAHQFNVSRLIPEWPLLNWLKYLLNLIGL